MTEILSRGSTSTANGHTNFEQQNETTDPSQPKASLSPQLTIDPASEWANNTISALDSSDQLRTAVSPGPEFPGGYPYTPSSLEPGPSFEEMKDAAKQYLSAAGEYVPSHEDVKKMAQNAGLTVRGYMPNGVVTCLGPLNPHQEAVVTSPIEESETTPVSGGGFVLINRGVRITDDEAQGSHEPQHTPVDSSGSVPSELPSTIGKGSGSLNTSGQPNSKGNGNAVSFSLASGQASEDASTKTQPGSLADPERRRGGTDATPTPFSYTGHSIGGGTIIGPSTSQIRVPASYGFSDKGIADPIEGLENETRNHPAGVINHGDAEVLVEPQGQGLVIAPDAGVAAGPGPGPGIIGPTVLQASKESSTSICPDGGSIAQAKKTPKLERDEKMEGKHKPTERKNKGETSKEEVAGEKNKQISADAENVVASAEAAKAGPTRSHEKPKPADEKVQAGPTDNDKLNTKARTHPLGKDGTQWKGVPLDEQYQAALDRDEDRGLTIGETKGPTSPKATVYPTKRGSSGTKSPVEKAVSSTATTGHDRATSGTSGMSSRYSEPVATNGKPRPGSPMTSADNPHVGRATTGPNAKKLADPAADRASLPEDQQHGRKKSNLMQRLKTWSKRLSQGGKSQN